MQVYQKLQEDMRECGEIVNKERMTENRLTKSQADLTEIRTYARKTINSAPHVKPTENYDKYEFHFVSQYTVI